MGIAVYFGSLDPPSSIGKAAFSTRFRVSYYACWMATRARRGKLPKESTHEGFQPALLEGADEDTVASWIAQRITEVERAVNKMSTITVLVNAEEDVKPMAERLTVYLESVNLKAVVCEEGKALDEGADVRFFDIQQIKGLEFEAVFFTGVDRLAEKSRSCLIATCISVQPVLRPTLAWSAIRGFRKIRSSAVC